MLKLSKKGDYAIKATIFLAKHMGDSFTIKQISSNLNISESLLRRIIADLKKHNIIESTKGRNGGIRIGKNLEKISLYDIFIAIGEDVGVSNCSIGNYCEKSGICNTEDIYGLLQKGLTGILKIYTVDKIINT